MNIDLKRELTAAETSVVRVMAYVAHQRGLLAGLEREGQDRSIPHGQVLLAALEDCLRLHLRVRDRIRQVLETTGSAAPPTAGVDFLPEIATGSTFH
jgi:hypothetical protein